MTRTPRLAGYFVLSTVMATVCGRWSRRRWPVLVSPQHNPAWQDAVGRGHEPSRLAVNAVHFTPGARTAWHSHGAGQTLHVTEGEGLVQTRGELVVPIRVGDTVFTPADEWHWHGATARHFMTHLSMTEGAAQWGEHVTDAEYTGEHS